MTTSSTCFSIPQRPGSPIDALNRRAAAVGSPGYAALTAYADYNGHHVTLSWNTYRQYYVAEYFWAGRIVIARGDFESCLRAVLAEYNRGAIGASAAIYPREDDVEAIALCKRTEVLVAGDGWQSKDDGTRKLEASGWTWRHQCAVESVRDYAHPHSLAMVFDWELMQACDSREAYEAAIKAKHGRVYQ